jgi:hypothetical protein
MPVITRRKPAVKVTCWRRSVTLQTLQMMVMSGVVRPADLNPPLSSGRVGFQLPDNPHATPRRESASEQGWLARLFLGRKPQAPWQLGHKESRHNA